MKKKMILIVAILIFISVGFAYIATNLNVLTGGLIKIRNSKVNITYAEAVAGANAEVSNFTYDEGEATATITFNELGDYVFIEFDIKNDSAAPYQISNFYVTADGMSDEEFNRRFIVSTYGNAFNYNTRGENIIDPIGAIIDGNTGTTYDVGIFYDTDVTEEDLTEEDTNFTINVHFEFEEIE